MAWTKTNPIDHTKVNALAGVLRTNNTAIEAAIDEEHDFTTGSTQTGIHAQGSARCFFQDSAPSTRVSGDAFTSADLGSLWFDTNSDPDNQFNVLTAVGPVTWTPVSTEIIATLLASARVFGSTLGVTGNFAVNTSKFTVAASTGNTLVAGTLDVTGNIDPTTFETTNGGFLDEDDMASDAADKVASQQSIKAYIASQVAALADSRVKGWGNVASNGTLNNGYNVASVTHDGTGIYTVTWDTDFSSANYSVVATLTGITTYTSRYVITVYSQAAGSCVINTYDSYGGTKIDLAFNVMACGDQ